ncbi:MAG: glycosyltransferase family 2 protein [Leptospirales bacterium]
MKKPEISVVITMYRENFLLVQAIESVLSQTFRDFEIVLVDNNCTSVTREVAERYVSMFPGKIRIVHEPVQGVCSARNAGISAAAGRYIATLDGDDMMRPTRLARQHVVLKGRQDLSMVFCGCDFLDDVSKRIKRWNVQNVSGVWREMEALLQELFAGSPNRNRGEGFRLPISMTTLFFRKETALEAGLFDPRMNPRDGDDWEFACRMYMKGGFAIVPEALAVYRMDSPQSAEYKKDPDNIRNLYRQGEKFFAILWENNARTRKSRSILKKINAVHLRIAGRHFMSFRKGIPVGRMILLRACLLSPTNPDAWKLWLKSFFPVSLLPRLFWFDRPLSDDSLPEGLDRRYALSVFPCPPRGPEAMVRIPEHGSRSLSTP